MTELAGSSIAIEGLPDFASLLQLRDALHGVSGGRRAAVLVGAGFSRNADLAAGDGALPPLWHDFSRGMAERLEPGSSAPHGDALRLAEEFCVAFGRAALEDLIRKLVPDSTWNPGNPHLRLMSLPWTDVLTTNWDTLLERAAAQTLERQYGVVRTVGDMATARPPRIVKLHGSLPSHTPFILTEEDYRRYPTTHTAFVNLARQIFIENELVLLGFSGEDPNFLQWAGWVRDQLQDQTRRLYLVGVLKLPPTRRQLLLSKNIVPIDLFGLVEQLDRDQQHPAATAKLLSFLEAGKPPSPMGWPNWANPRPYRNSEGLDTEKAATLVAAWRAQRLVYPGWLFCPFPGIAFVRREVSSAKQWFMRSFDGLPRELQVAVVREMAWLCLLSGHRLLSCMVAVAKTVVATPTADIDSAGRLEIARALLLQAHHMEDSEFLACATAAGELGGQGPLWRDFALATWHVHRLDFAAAEPLVQSLRSEDPVWKLRRAGLFVSLGEVNAAQDLYLEALVALRERLLREPTSLWIRSRVRWAEFLAEMALAFRKEPSANPLAALSRERARSGDDDGCDPYRLLEVLSQSLEEADRSYNERNGKRDPRFDAGIYYERPKRLAFSTGGDELRPQDEIRHIFDELALTGLTGHHDYFRSFVRHFACTVTRPDSFELNWILHIADSSSDMPLIDRYLNRGAVARLETSVAKSLTSRMRSAINYGFICYEEAATRDRRWGDSADFWQGRLSTSFEVLSRLSTRCTRDEAKELYIEVLGWADQPALREWTLHESYATLLKRAWGAVHPDDHQLFCVDHLLFPLANEADRQRMDRWPDPLEFPGQLKRPEANTKAEHRIEQLIELARSSVPVERHAGLLRLQNALNKGLLTADEIERYGQAYWSVTDASGLPSETGLWDYVALIVKNPDQEDSAVAFRKRYLEGPPPTQPFDDAWMRNVRCACKGHLGAAPHRPTAESAQAWLRYILAWPDIGETPELQSHHREEARRELGWFLMDAVLPYLPSELADDQLRSLLSLYDDLATTLPSATALALQFPGCSSQAQELIRTALWSSNRQRALHATLAVYRWIEDDPTDSLEWSSLAFDVVALCGVPRHPGSAWLWKCAQMLVAYERLDSSATDRLVLALKSLHAAADFNAWDGVDPQWEEQAPLVLRGAVITALSLQKRGQMNDTITAWTARVGTDPLPEVRFANFDLHDS